MREGGCSGGLGSEEGGEIVERERGEVRAIERVWVKVKNGFPSGRGSSRNHRFQ